MECTQEQIRVDVVTLLDLPDYEVHRDGRVFRVRGQQQGEVKNHDNQRGYRILRLRTAGHRRTYKVHRLVCRAFHGDPPLFGEDEAHCRHIDGNRLNNHADNLCWGTRSDNERDKKRFYGRW